MVYLDANAASPLTRGARAAILQHLDKFHFGNPSSIHRTGQSLRSVLEGARDEIARSIDAYHSSQVVFTSSGTEANQLAIRSFLEDQRGGRWLLSPIEHPSVISMSDWAESKGIKVEFIPVDQNGRVKISELGRMIEESLKPALVSVQWVNNETGLVQPIQEVVSLIKRFGICSHVDAAQAWGKFPLSVREIDADCITFSGHKIGAPSGVGFVWSNKPIRPMVYGSQEKGRRGGAENLLSIVSMAAAARELNPKAHSQRLLELKSYLETELVKIPGAKIHAKDADRVPNTTSVSFSEVKGRSLLISLDLKGFAVSTGAACSSGVDRASHVLRAMGCSEQESLSTIRVSLHSEISYDEIKRFIEALKSSVEKIRYNKDFEKSQNI